MNQLNALSNCVEYYACRLKLYLHVTGERATPNSNHSRYGTDGLIPNGLFGTSRGEIARNLILDRLKQLAAYRLVKTDSSNNGIEANPDKP